MRESFSEFKELIRVELQLETADISDQDIKQLFMLAFLSGQKEAILNPLL